MILMIIILLALLLLIGGFFYSMNDAKVGRAIIGSGLLVLAGGTGAVALDDGGLHDNAVLLQNTEVCGGDVRCEAIFTINVTSDKQLQRNINMFITMEDRQGNVRGSVPWLPSVDYITGRDVPVNRTVVQYDYWNETLPNGTVITRYNSSNVTVEDTRVVWDNKKLEYGKNYIKIWTDDKPLDEWVDWHILIKNVPVKVAGIDTQRDFDTHIKGWAVWGDSSFPWPAELDAWTYRFNITVDSSYVTENLDDYPLYLNASSFPATFFGNVTDGGKDVVFTDNSGINLSREIVFLNKSTNDGELYVRVNLSSSSDTVVWLYYNNSAYSRGNDLDTWNDDFQIVLHGNNISSTFVDSTGKITFTNVGTTVSTGQVGRALDFANTAISGGSGVDNKKLATFEFFFRPDNTLTSAGSAEYYLEANTVLSRGTFVFESFSGACTGERSGLLDDGAQRHCYTGGDIDTSWHSHAWYWNASLGQYELFFDNVSVATVHGGGTPTLGVLDNPYFGRLDVPSAPYSGLLDEIRISNVTRTPAWFEFTHTNIFAPDDTYTIGLVGIKNVDAAPLVNATITNSTPYSSAQVNFSCDIFDDRSPMNITNWTVYRNSTSIASGSNLTNLLNGSQPVYSLTAGVDYTYNLTCNVTDGFNATYASALTGVFTELVQLANVTICENMSGVYFSANLSRGTYVVSTNTYSEADIVADNSSVCGYTYLINNTGTHNTTYTLETNHSRSDAIMKINGSIINSTKNFTVFVPLSGVERFNVTLNFTDFDLTSPSFDYRLNWTEERT